MDIITFLALYNELVSIDDLSKKLYDEQKRNVYSKFSENKQKQLKALLTKFRSCIQEYMKELE